MFSLGDVVLIYSSELISQFTLKKILIKVEIPKRNKTSTIIC